VNGRSDADTQEALDDFLANAGRKGRAKPARIELAKATTGDFETWLRDAGGVADNICVQKAKPPKPEVATKPARQQQRVEPQRRRAERPAAEPREPAREKKFCWGPRNELNPC
jgi:hypothetical protein